MEPSMAKSLKEPPAYAVTSVDHALRLAAMLQLEGAITVSVAAERLGVARSTAHRLLSMLVYRDFAVQIEDRSYRSGPVLELATHANSDLGALRVASIGPLRQLADSLDETANLSVRTGTTCRFLLSAEGSQALRVSNREGMVFPAHQVTGGLIGLAALSDEQVEALYDEARFARSEERPEMSRLFEDLRAVRRTGVAVNLERSERGLAAVGVPVRDPAGDTVAAVALSLPTIRYEPERVSRIIAALHTASDAIARHLPKPTAAGSSPAVTRSGTRSSLGSTGRAEP
jgi:DNA-binding IclR family transcriptional regulator